MRLPMMLTPVRSERVLDDLIVGAGLAALAELQVSPEVALREDPAVELAPLGPPILVGRVAGVLQVHAWRCEISVEGDARRGRTPCSSVRAFRGVVW